MVEPVERCIAIVNSTSNFLLARLSSGSTFDRALQDAQQAGYAEPDPSRDLDGLDAADKLTLLASLFGWGELGPSALEVHGIRGLRTSDLAAAREIDCRIKPVVFAARRATAIEAFVGPALVSSREPLAAIDGVLNGIRLDGRYVSNLFVSGPGAGPDVTAATLLDDEVESPTSTRALHRDSSFASIEKRDQPLVMSRPLVRCERVTAPITRWFVRLVFPGVVPSHQALHHLLVASGLELEQIVAIGQSSSAWIATGLHARHEVESACGYLRSTHRIESHPLRRLL